MIDQLNQAVADYSLKHFKKAITPDWSIPEQAFGDLTTNAAMIHAKQLGVHPRELAEKLVREAGLLDVEGVETAVIEGPGFINIAYTDDVFLNTLTEISKRGDSYGAPDVYSQQKVVVEFSDPNPFKPLHVGHLYTSIMGDVISRLVANAGGDVIRVNFGGDVGLHVAKSMWAIGKALDGFDVQALQQIPETKRSSWLGERYVEGAAAYEDNEGVQHDIVTLNKQIYELHQNSSDSNMAQVYWEARQWSYDYFDRFYERIHVPFDAYMPESENAQLGLQTVSEHIADGVYEKDNGAVVFKGEPYGLHTRVFINSEGLPTYEAKDVGVAVAKWNRYTFDESIIITGKEISEYMKVVLKSMEPYLPEVVARTRHLTHGHIKIKKVGKMSSRLGNALSAEAVLEATKQLITESNDQTQQELIMLGAIRYSFLKQRMGDDVQFDVEESVRTVGNSGPYLQYALVRAKSILRNKIAGSDLPTATRLTDDERTLVRTINQFETVLETATRELEPHTLCNYLYELAQEFNRFYENNPVIHDEREDIRLTIVSCYAVVLQNGLKVLGIPIIDRM